MRQQELSSKSHISLYHLLHDKWKTEVFVENQASKGTRMSRRRTTIFGSAQIVVGDKTTHGGVVVTGSPTASWYGIPIARKMDKVTCPRCEPHLFEIAEGLNNCTDTDAKLPMAVEGHRTTCGATLIAEQAGPYALAKAFHPDRKYSHDEQVLLKDGRGQPMPDTYYTAKMPSGELVCGCTDAEGKTERFMTNGAHEIEIHLGHIDDMGDGT